MQQVDTVYTITLVAMQFAHRNSKQSIWYASKPLSSKQVLSASWFIATLENYRVTDSPCGMSSERPIPSSWLHAVCLNLCKASQHSHLGILIWQKATMLPLLWPLDRQSAAEQVMMHREPKRSYGIFAWEAEFNQRDFNDLDCPIEANAYSGWYSV